MHKLMAAVLFFLNNIFIADALACSNLDDASIMYARFLEIAYNNVKNEDGNSYFEVRSLNDDDKKEAWLCLTKSAEKNNCNAIYVVELYYRYGMGNKHLGVEKNLELAQRYREKFVSYCAK